jgi:hypothetical protein
MSVKVTYECDGCENVSDPVMLESKFVALSGKSYGLGSRVCERAKDKAPAGWIAYDLIGCCYCPDCAAEFKEGEES